MKTAFSVMSAFFVVCVLVGCGTRCGNLPSTVATVNGQDISADDYVKQMTATMGQGVLQNMIQQRIVAQWAEKAGVAPTDKQINKQIDELKNDGQYEDRVKLYGEDAVKSELRFLQARINLAKKYTKITDDELKSTYERMKNKFVHGPRKVVAIILNAKKNRIEQALKAVKAGRDFDEVAREYTDRNLVPNPPIKFPLLVDQPMPGQPGLAKAVKSTKVGGVSAVFTVVPPGGQKPTYAVLKVLSAQPARNSKLAQVKDLVEDQVALQNSQFDQDFLKKLNAKMKAADVKVNIEHFKDLESIIKNPPEPMGMVPPQP